MSTAFPYLPLLPSALPFPPPNHAAAAARVTMPPTSVTYFESLAQQL